MEDFTAGTGVSFRSSPFDPASIMRRVWCEEKAVFHSSVPGSSGNPVPLPILPHCYANPGPIPPHRSRFWKMMNFFSSNVFEFVLYASSTLLISTTLNRR